MSKAAKREKSKRRKFFKRLSSTNPHKFDREWERRLSSWLIEIERKAGKLYDDEGETIPPIFGIVDEALHILEGCGENIFNKYAKYTVGLLTTQCCMSFSKKVLPQLYRINNGRHLEFKSIYQI